MSYALKTARQLVDKSHTQDPAYIDRSKTDELSYADSVEKWAFRLIHLRKDDTVFQEFCNQIDPSSQQEAIELLLLAARCQHLERFLTPRSTYPQGKAGYLKWRRDLYFIQADRANQLLIQAGVSQFKAELVKKWVSKVDLKPGKNDGDLGTQLLEDVAILVFIQDELQQFAAQHQDYPEQKFIDIIKKTWRKLSSLGKQEALKLDMPNGIDELIKKAVISTEDTIQQEDSLPSVSSTAADTANATATATQTPKKTTSSSAPYVSGTFQRALRPKTAAEAEAMLAQHAQRQTNNEIQQDGKDDDDDDKEEKKEEEPKFFGARLLKDEQGVWDHNAWDHVEPPPEHLEMVEQLLAKQAETKLTLEEGETYHSNPSCYWDTFYGNHLNRFFKDRKWLHLEFPELVEATLPSSPSTTILEVGCGAGNTVFPLLEINQNPNLTIHACDYSKEAVSIVTSNPLFHKPKCFANVWDVSSSTYKVPPNIQPGSVDIIVLIFVFSALHPREWIQAVENLRNLLKPKTGLLLLRDYGRHDLPQLRFKKKRMLDENFYLRGDGTRVYFFTPEELIQIFHATPAPPQRSVEQLLLQENQESITDITCSNVNFTTETDQQVIHFETIQMANDRRLLVNRKEKKKMYRVWMQAKFRLL